MLFCFAKNSEGNIGSTSLLKMFGEIFFSRGVKSFSQGEHLSGGIFPYFITCAL